MLKPYIKLFKKYRRHPIGHSLIGAQGALHAIKNLTREISKHRSEPGRYRELKIQGLCAKREEAYAKLAACGAYLAEIRHDSPSCDKQAVGALPIIVQALAPCRHRLEQAVAFLCSAMHQGYADVPALRPVFETLMEETAQAQPGVAMSIYSRLGRAVLDRRLFTFGPCLAERLLPYVDRPQSYEKKIGISGLVRKLAQPNSLTAIIAQEAFEQAHRLSRALRETRSPRKAKRAARHSAGQSSFISSRRLSNRYCA